ncbi:MAG: hypothetical protein ACP5QU_09770, partial [Anaerolineae bacterium]
MAPRAQPDLGQGHGLGFARQHERRDRARRFTQDSHPRTGRSALPALPRRSSPDRQQNRGGDSHDRADLPPPRGSTRQGARRPRAQR